ncbi:ABC transporter efflux protein, DrrB family [Cryptosporangium aurantiacum]|uniref:ABC transporter efflux protein, DrrB family n=1 Tax=Cryptosporangium aurantiacum TaxID=134849 RepID=A0A1M7Q6V2_9ACTN|nr:ABC transporter efflux protein, DrrB family [Cryptosporangium aurantiacum]
MFVVLFAYVFGSAVVLPGGGNYREFLMPGIFTQSMALMCTAMAVAVATDRTSGFIDRLRSLPMARSAALGGHVLSVMLQAVLGLVTMGLLGYLVGWRIRTDVAHAAAAYGLLLLLALAMLWVGAFTGLVARSVTIADQATFAWAFPLTFLANTFVPSQGLPGWLRPLAEWNPVASTVAAVRTLFGNPVPPHGHSFPLDHPVLMSLCWSLALLAVFAPLAVRRFQQASR